MCAGLRVVHRDLRNARDRGLCVDRAVRVQDAAVPMRGVLAETHVRCDVYLRKECPDFFDCEDDGPLRIVRRGAPSVLNDARRIINYTILFFFPIGDNMPLATYLFA